MFYVLYANGFQMYISESACSFEFKISKKTNYYSTSDLRKLYRILNLTYIKIKEKEIVFFNLETPAQLFEQETKIPPFTFIYNQ